MKQETIITELFADIEKFGWNLVKDKIHFYKNAEKLQMLKSWIDGKEDNVFGNSVFEDANQYYNKIYGEEESN